MIKTHLKYLRYVLRHKWFVLIEGRKLGLGWWRLIVHDWSKFSSAEFGPYARFFYGDEPSSKTGGPMRKATPEFAAAWKHHWQNNPHHWEYWAESNFKGKSFSHLIAPMPDVFRREMLADWRAAGRAITGTDNTVGWYAIQRDKIVLHPETREWIESQLGYSEFGESE